MGVSLGDPNTAVPHELGNLKKAPGLPPASRNELRSRRMAEIVPPDVSPHPGQLEDPRDGPTGPPAEVVALGVRSPVGFAEYKALKDVWGPFLKNTPRHGEERDTAHTAVLGRLEAVAVSYHDLRAGPIQNHILPAQMVKLPETESREDTETYGMQLGLVERFAAENGAYFVVGEKCPGLLGTPLRRNPHTQSRIMTAQISMDGEIVGLAKLPQDVPNGLRASSASQLVDVVLDFELFYLRHRLFEERDLMDVVGPPRILVF